MMTAVVVVAVAVAGFCRLNVVVVAEDLALGGDEQWKNRRDGGIESGEFG